jgi:hypothetical protein
MSEQATKIGFGYVDDTSDDLRTKSGGVFGLNPGCFVSKFEYNPNAGADGTATDALDIHLLVGDKEFRRRIYEPTKVYKDGVEIADTNSKEFIDGYNDQWKQSNAVIVHILKAFRTEAEVKQGLSIPIPDFRTFLITVQSLMPNGFNSKPVDAFLEYQWNINSGQDRTYLQMPSNMKGQYFLVPAQPGPWKEQLNDDGSMIYVNPTGQQHPFKRDKNYMESKKAIQQIEGQQPVAGAANMAPPQGGAAAATGATW